MHIRLVIFLFLALSSALDWGKWSWSNSGTQMSTDVISFNPSLPPGCSVNGPEIIMGQAWSPRITLSGDGGNTFYRFPNLLGKTLSLDVDVSKTVCSCNAAFFFISPPPGTPISEYCDGQTNCTEIDVMEANAHGLQVTPHCGTGGDTCHQGCSKNYRSAQGFGPGGSGVDTGKPFNIWIKFSSDDGNTLNALEGGARQAGKSGISYLLNDQICSSVVPGNPKNFISNLSKDVKGNLVLMVAFWRGDMNWLDGCSSEQTCPDSCLFTFGNFTIS